MKVTVIGLGPGGGADLTGRARAALEACDLIVGYTAYIDLVRADCPQKETLSTDRKSTRLNSSHVSESRMPSSA